MKKLFALIVALVMALSCTLALAEESSAAFPGITINAELDIDRAAASQHLEMFGLEDDALATANGIVALLDSLNEKTVITADGLQYELGLNGNDVLSLGGSLNENGLVIVSSLIPSYALTVSMETISGVLEMAMSFMSSNNEEGKLPFDVNAVAQAVSGYIDPFVQKINASIAIGETEVGEFEYEGHKFNAKTAVNVDTKAISEAVNTLVDQLNKDETVQAALKAMEGAGVSVNMPEEPLDLESEDAPNVEVYIYTYVDEAGNASDEVYVLVTVTPQDDPEAGTFVHTLVMGRDAIVTIEIPAETTTLRFTKQEERDDGGLAMSLEVNARGMYVAGAVDLAFADTIHCVFDAYFLNQAKPLATATIDIALNGELTMDVTGKGKEIVAIEDLIGGGEAASEATSGLMMDLLLNGLGGMMGTISENVPELSDSLGSIMSGMMGM